MTTTARTYRSAATEGATHLGLLLATYDVLADDIRLAGDAAAKGLIEERCRLSSHATLLLGHLESWVPLLGDPVLETSLIRFYAFMRAELMRLQSETEGGAFADLALQVGETRAAWQQKGDLLQSAHAKKTHEPEILRPEVLQPNTAARLSWSA